MNYHLLVFTLLGTIVYPGHMHCMQNNKKKLKKKLNNELCYALSTGNNYAAKQLVAQGANVNCRITLLPPPGSKNIPMYRGATPLHIATLADNADMAEHLLQHGANISAKTLEKLQSSDGYGQNCTKETYLMPLHLAAQSGSYSVACCLLNNGANVNYTSKNIKSTPLEYATRKYYFDIIKLFIAHNATMDPRCLPSWKLCLQSQDPCAYCIHHPDFDNLCQDPVQKLSITNPKAIKNLLAVKKIKISNEDALIFAYRTLATPLFDQLWKDAMTRDQLKNHAHKFCCQKRLVTYIQNNKEATAQKCMLFKNLAKQNYIDAHNGIFFTFQNQ